MKSLIIGLTGPTGAGKSTVREVFEDVGFEAVDADALARKVTEKGSPVLKSLAIVFGADIISSDGALDRRLLAKRAFAGRVSAAVLNLITHPAILRLSDIKIREALSRGKNVIIDAPLLFEADMQTLCSSVISVLAPQEQRLERIMARDDLSREQARQRIGTQHDDQYYIERSDFILRNDSGTDALLECSRRLAVSLMEGASDD